jgi:hypothetical protein
MSRIQSTEFADCLIKYAFFFKETVNRFPFPLSKFLILATRILVRKETDLGGVCLMAVSDFPSAMSSPAINQFGIFCHRTQATQKIERTKTVDRQQDEG